jgi:ribonuclease HI
LGILHPIHGALGRIVRRTVCHDEQPCAVDALIKALEATPAPKLTVVSDARYVTDGGSAGIVRWKRFGWRLSPKGAAVKNVELWKRLDSLLIGRQVSWVWVRHGKGGEDHDACWRLARNTALAQCLLSASDENVALGGVVHGSEPAEHHRWNTMEAA